MSESVNQKDRLAAEEAERWAEVLALVERLTPTQLEEPGLTAEGWSVKDLLWHLAGWCSEAERQLGLIRTGAYEERDWDTDGINARLLEESRRLSLGEVRSGLEAARAGALREWAAIDEVTPEALEWFGESGPIHYDEHLPALRAWVERLDRNG
ncbi:MAG TPA: maleylpyruvate isomerase N-terminal domain-containing protein [Actinomycetota bacterium]|nr:maleylpyruvate isomerase N-terminal domain-containing protein [Actinomycetota bacterium]